jgi:hypothetical protein
MVALFASAIFRLWFLARAVPARIRRGTLVAALIGEIATCPRQVEAAYVSVDAISQLQLYSVHSPFGAPILSRERLVHQLALDAYADPVGPEDSHATWAFHSRLRLDGDYGISNEERDTNNDAAFIPGLQTSPVDLSYGYLEVSGLLRNSTGVALGRQLFFNELGFWSFDGAKLSFSPGRLFELSGYAGYEQRGGVPFLTTSRYEADGVFRGDRENMSSSQWPGYVRSTELAPAFGASLSLSAVPGIRARVDYRRVTQHDRVVTLPFADENGHVQTIAASRVSSERFGVGLGADWSKRGSLDGAWVYDLYRRVSQEHRVQLLYRPNDEWRFAAGYEYRLPIFDADSIFNWFGAKGSLLGRLSASVALPHSISLTVTGGARWLGVGPSQFLAEGLTTGPNGGVDGILRVESVYSTQRERLGSALRVEAGEAGRNASSDLSYRRGFLENRLETLAQVTAGYWQNPLLPERAQSSVMYVAGVRLFPGGKQEFSTEWEHVIAEGPYQRFRVLATVAVRVP